MRFSLQEAREPLQRFRARSCTKNVRKVAELFPILLSHQERSAGLVVNAFLLRPRKTWLAGRSLAMTNQLELNMVKGSM